MVTLIGALANFALNLLFIPYFGIIGAAYATIISFGLLAAGKIYFSRKFIHFHQDYKFISKVFIASILMAALLFSIKYLVSINIYILLGLIGLGFSLYIGLMFILKGIDRKMIRKILQIVKS
jgi:O-antigen/teichoic acid export membrane protein